MDKIGFGGNGWSKKLRKRRTSLMDVPLAAWAASSNSYWSRLSCQTCSLYSSGSGVPVILSSISFGHLKKIFFRKGIGLIWKRCRNFLRIILIETSLPVHNAPHFSMIFGFAMIIRKLECVNIISQESGFSNTTIHSSKSPCPRVTTFKSVDFYKTNEFFRCLWNETHQ